MHLLQSLSLLSVACCLAHASSWPSKRVPHHSFPSSTTRTISVIDFGADPTGQNDSTSAIVAAAAHLSNLSTGNPSVNGYDYGLAKLDMANGHYVISSPIIINTSLTNVIFADGSIRASTRFPPGQYMFEFNSSRVAAPFEGIRIHNLILDGNGIANGILGSDCAHTLIDGVWVYGFYDYGIHFIRGFEYYVTNSWVSGGDTSDQSVCMKHNATGIAMEASDSSITDTVVFCTKLGIYLNGGNTIVQNVHIYNSGHYHYFQNHSLFPFGGLYVHDSHGARIQQVYFDDTTLLLHAATDSIITDCIWLLGEWNSQGGLFLVPYCTKNETMISTIIKNNVISEAPSFDPVKVVGQRFIQMDTTSDQYKYLQGVHISDNNAARVQRAASTFSLPSTAVQLSLRQTAQVFRFDFTKQLLLPKCQITQAQVSVVCYAMGRSNSACPQHASVWTDINILQVTLEDEADALVTAAVDQSYCT